MGTAIGVGLIAGLAGAVVAWVVASRKVANPYRRSLEALARDLRAGRTAASAEVAAEQPPEVQDLRSAVAEGWTARGSKVETAGEGTALSRFAGFLRRSVAEPLSQGLEGDESKLRSRVDRVLDAVEDTEFFLEEPDPEFGMGSVTTALQEVSRELTQELSTTVRVGLPDRPVRARLAPEAFKDAVYLILANAAHFSGGRSVEMTMEEEEGRCRIAIRDRGPGFSEEALERATEPFFTTEEGALGLGLGRAARIVEMHAGELRLGNRDGEGAEVQIILPTRG